MFHQRILAIFLATLGLPRGDARHSCGRRKPVLQPQLGISMAEMLNSHGGYSVSLNPTAKAPSVRWPFREALYPVCGMRLSLQVFYEQPT